MLKQFDLRASHLAKQQVGSPPTQTQTTEPGAFSQQPTGPMAPTATLMHPQSSGPMQPYPTQPQPMSSGGPPSQAGKLIILFMPNY